MGDLTRPASVSVGAPSATNGRRPDPHFEVMLITPEQAQEWIDNCNKRNRPVKWRSVKQYAGAIRRGEWKLNGDAIRFDTEGILIDGQNRLWAIVEAGMPVRSLVGTGLEPEAQDTMDLGVKRSLADVLALAGESDTSKLAVIIRWSFMYDRFVNAEASMDHRIDPPTLQQLVAYFKDGRKGPLTAALKEGNKAYRAFRPMPATVAAVAYSIFRPIQWEDCEDFFFKLRMGASLDVDNPVWVLRRWMQNNHARTYNRATVAVQLAITIKAWNHYKDGTTVEYLKWSGGGSAPERFPIARSQ